MTIKETYHLFRTQLLSIYPKNESDKICKMIFESLANLTSSDILIYHEKKIDAETNFRLEKALEELLKFKPVQYVIGHCWFYKMPFKVNEHVLIPRPETEELVQDVIDFLKKSPQKKLLEIGSGSGCISVSIKKNISETEITSIDISLEALIVAKENAFNHQTAIDFLELNFLNNEDWNRLGIYDVIVSNPPYIPNSEFTSMDNHVKLFEPATALFVPDNQPLLFYEKIIEFSKDHLTPNGYIFIEIHENHGHTTSELFSTNGFSVELKKDMQGKDRIIKATRNL